MSPILAEWLLERANKDFEKVLQDLNRVRDLYEIYYDRQEKWPDKKIWDEDVKDYEFQLNELNQKKEKLLLVIKELEGIKQHVA